MTIPYHQTDIWTEISAIKRDIYNLKAFHSASKTNEERQENTHLASLQDENRKILKENTELKEEVLA